MELDPGFAPEKTEDVPEDALAKLGWRNRYQALGRNGIQLSAEA